MKENSLQQYFLVVKELCQLEDKELNLITSDDINHFLVYNRNVKKVSSCSVKNKFLLLSSVYNYLFKHKLISDNPMTDVETPKAQSKVKTPLTELEIEKLKRTAEEYIGVDSARKIAIMYFMLDTGVRVSEMCNMNITDIDFDNLTANVINGKGGKDRVVYFTEKTKYRLQEYFRLRSDLSDDIVKINTAVFVSLKKPYTRMTKSGVETELKKLGEKSGVTRVHPHLLRATFATRLAEKGVGIDVIAKLLGHSNLYTINRYVLMQDDKIKSMIRGVA